MFGEVFVRGLIVGLSVAAPVGPMAVLCTRRTLAHGRLAGLVTGLGVATGDGCYGAVAGFGLTLVSQLLLGQQTWLRLIGGLFLCYLGVKVFLAPVAGRAATADAPSLARAYAEAVGLTLTNPATILAFAAIVAGVSVEAGAGDYGSTALLVLGVVLGSALWWTLLTTVIGTLRAKVTPARLLWINRVSGSVIVAFGLVALATVLRVR